MDIDFDFDMTTTTTRNESDAFPFCAAWDVFCLSDLWTWDGPIGRYLSLDDIIQLDAVCRYSHYSWATLFQCWVMKLGERLWGLDFANVRFKLIDWMMNSPDAASPSIIISTSQCSHGSDCQVCTKPVPIMYSYRSGSVNDRENGEKLEASYYGQPLGSIIRYDVGIHPTVRPRLERVERYKDDLPSILASSDPLIRMARPHMSVAVAPDQVDIPLIIAQKQPGDMLSPDCLYSQWLLGTPNGQKHLHYTMKYMASMCSKHHHYQFRHLCTWELCKQTNGTTILHLKTTPTTCSDVKCCYITYLYYQCKKTTTTTTSLRTTMGSLNAVERGMLRHVMIAMNFKPRCFKRANANFIKMNGDSNNTDDFWASFRNLYLDTLYKHITIDLSDIFTENGRFMSELVGRDANGIVDRWHRQGVDFATEWYRRIVNGQNPETPPWCLHTTDLKPSWLSVCPMPDMPLILDKANYMTFVESLLESLPFCADDKTTTLFSPVAFRSETIPTIAMTWMYNCIQTVQLTTQELINFTTFMSLLNPPTLHYHQSYKHLSRDWKLVLKRRNSHTSNDILVQCNMFREVNGSGVAVPIKLDKDSGATHSVVYIKHIPVPSDDDDDNALEKLKAIILDGRWGDCVFTLSERRRLASAVRHHTDDSLDDDDHSSSSSSSSNKRRKMGDEDGVSQYTKIERGFEHMSARQKQRFNLQHSVSKDQYPPLQSPLQAQMIMARREQLPLMADQVYRQLFGSRATTFTKGNAGPNQRARHRILHMTALRDYVGIINGHGAITLDLEQLRNDPNAKLDAIVPVIQDTVQYKVVLQQAENHRSPNICEIDLATGVILFAGGVNDNNHHLLDKILRVARDPDAYIRNEMQHCFACGIPAREVCACRLLTIRQLRQHACRLK